MEAVFEGAWYLASRSLHGEQPLGEGRPAGQGQRWEAEGMRAQREGLGPLLRSPAGLGHCPGRGPLTETP